MVAQVAVAVMLVIGAGLMSRSYIRLLETEPGFDATSILTFRVDLPTGAYRDLERVADYHARILDRLEALPGVETVAATATIPFQREIPFLGNFLVQTGWHRNRGRSPGTLPAGVTGILRDHGDRPRQRP